MTAPAPGAGLRGDFPTLRRRVDGRPVIYLDSAATALKPSAVIAAVTRYYETSGASIHRGKHFLSEEASDQYEQARARVAQRLGCYGDEVVFVKNTTEALNLVARGLPLNRSDLVVATLDSHHSLLLPWRGVATVRHPRLDDRGRVDVDSFRALMRERPAVVAITHCSNVTGAYAPLELLLGLAKEAGALTVVDAAQSMPHRRIDVGRLPVDFLAFSGHKLLAPSGVGVLYGRREALQRLAPLALGGGTVDFVTEGDHQLRKVPHRFEAGTPDIAAVLGLAAALDYLERVGDAALAGHDHALARLMVEEAARRDYLQLIGPPGPEDRAAIASLRLRGCDDLSDVARMLSDGYGVMCRSGHLCAQPLVDRLCPGEVLRASAYLYNTPEDVLALFAALDEVHPLVAKR